MIRQSFSFRLGAFECLVVWDAIQIAGLDWLPNNPPEEVKAALLADGNPHSDTLAFCINALAIRTDTDIVLVDTSIEFTQTLPETLKANGIDPAAVTRVIISHGHGDHIGGIAYEDDVLTYPNARYSMSKVEWDDFWAAAHKDDEPNLVARRSLSAIQGKVDFVDYDHETEIMPGFCMIPAPGHTLGQMAVLVQSQGESLLYMADAIHQPLQVARPEWTPAYEMLPDVSPVTRRTLVERAAREGWLAMAYHFPFPALGHIRSENGKLVWEPLERAAAS